MRLLVLAALVLLCAVPALCAPPVLPDEWLNQLAEAANRDDLRAQLSSVDGEDVSSDDLVREFVQMRVLLSQLHGALRKWNDKKKTGKPLSDEVCIRMRNYFLTLTPTHWHSFDASTMRLFHATALPDLGRARGAHTRGERYARICATATAAAAGAHVQPEWCARRVRFRWNY